ncbi:hypothetical protein [Bradyrhizobium sp. CCBAU 53338]|uniref:hypothetical protein n=1 Tax=Bradyrhizobium sp. CCBAU 53338 TaxID=1325111 RepID=UPI00188D8F23|nr:hypothetical protein [Bradyrhizobium sp. CCBAU 53338]QOZ54813.1 hypothetical protein XH90_28095 [Bradyrhizobium sp. CCBAU 53338]
MPIKPLPPITCYGDLERGRQIVCSWKLGHLSRADVEIVARAIAQGIAEGRRHGVEFAQVRPDANHEVISEREAKA